MYRFDVERWGKRPDTLLPHRSGLRSFRMSVRENAGTGRFELPDVFRISRRRHVTGVL